MKDSIPTYVISIDDDDELGVDRLSLVARPAVQTNFIALSEAERVHRVQLLKSKLAQQMLYGVVLKPDQLIYRNDPDGKEYNITFPKDQVVKIAQRYLKNGNQNKINIEHTDRMIPASVVESWITVDVDRDKIKAVGLAEDLPVGSWCVGIKVDKLEDWEAYVESGAVLGISLEGDFDHIIKLKQETMTENQKKLQQLQREIDQLKKQQRQVLSGRKEQEQGLLNKLKQVLGLAQGQGAKQKPVRMSDGQTLKIVRPKGFALGGKKWSKQITLFAQGGQARVLCTADGTTVKLKDGKYKLTTGGHVNVVGGTAMVTLAIAPTYTAEDGTGIYIDTENENMAYWIMEDGSTEVMEDGSYATADGKVIVIEDGKFVEIQDDEQEMEDEEDEDEEKMEDEEDEDASIQEITETLIEVVSELNDLKETIEEEMKKTEEMRQHLAESTGAKWQTSGTKAPKPTQRKLQEQARNAKPSLERLAEKACEEMKSIKRK